MLQRLLVSDSLISKLLTSLNKGQHITAFGLDQDARFLLLKETDKQFLYITNNLLSANKVADKLKKIGYNVGTLFPFDYNFSTFQNKVCVSNLSTLLSFNSNQLDCIVLPIDALKNKYPNLSSNAKQLETNKQYNREELTQCLNALGYLRQDSISDVGDYTLKGDILDICVEQNKCARISFFDDEIEKIYYYDKDTFATLNNADSIVLSSNCFSSIDDCNIKQLLKDLQTKSKGLKERSQIDEYEKLVTNINLLEVSKTKDISYLFPYNDKIIYSIFDLIDKDTMICFDDYKQCYEEFVRNEKEFVTETKQNIKWALSSEAHLKAIWKLDELKKMWDDFLLLSFGIITSVNHLYDTTKVFNIKTSKIINYTNNLTALNYDIKKYFSSGYTIILFAGSKEFGQRLVDSLHKERMESQLVASTTKIDLNKINILTKYLPLSAVFDVEKILVIGTNMLLNDKKSNINNDYIVELPKIGDYVVHESYGIGRYVESVVLEYNNASREYFVIEYKGGDKLYLPCEYMDKISKYVGEKPKESKLGSGDFLKIKESVKGSLKELAFDLKELYAKRLDSKGILVKRNSDVENEIAKSFEYTTTPDQESAIEDVYNDLASGKIMDRLVCGDVGYGKTEIAIRAIYKMIMAGYQVMFLCPTTILSIQHYNTCLSRLKEYGINVAVLNRFVSQKDRQKIISGLKSGKIDIVCGTHSLLSKELVVPKLGLLILDEEQKFGVGDKEKIKNMKKNIHVLTLSATPIPRTLHMSLVGIRDISVINTPPANRLNVITNVVGYSDELLKNAISRELSRGGQVLIINNSVERIYAFAQKVKMLVSDNSIRIGVAHGQMEEKELSSEISKLYDGQTQILVATTLIENGVDLPNANTLFIVDSDKLGLAQLYQLKGRVGRSGIQAYSYFTYDDQVQLNETAYKRLEAILEYSDLGSGYKIAMRDLEIRGAGNIFGAEQSGHMEKVGYNMYVTLLKECIDEMSGHYTPHTDCEIVTNINAYLPTYYVSGKSERIYWYSQIAKVSNEQDYDSMIDKMNEKIGPVCQEAENLVKVALLKNLCGKLNIKRVVINATETKMEFTDNESMSNFYQNLVDKNNVSVDVSANPSIVFVLQTDNLSKINNVLKNVINVYKGIKK